MVYTIGKIEFLKRLTVVVIIPETVDSGAQQSKGCVRALFVSWQDWRGLDALFNLWMSKGISRRTSVSWRGKSTNLFWFTLHNS